MILLKIILGIFIGLTIGCILIYITEDMDLGKQILIFSSVIILIFLTCPIWVYWIV